MCSNRITRRNLCKGAVMGAMAVPLLQDEKDPSLIGKTERTRFAMNAEMWWTRLPFLQRIEEAAKLGFPAVEFWPWRNKKIDQIKRLCEELEIEVAQFTAWGFVPGMNHPKKPR